MTAINKEKYKMTTLHTDPRRVLFKRDPMIYGHFAEHFHRDIYGGLYDPGHPLADEDGFRTDVLDAMRKIKVPILRWPGGCFVSAYHWQDGVGKDRTPSFDKAWRVEEPNTFGTDEYVKLCRKVGCEPYICTNAGTGSAEEMSDWVEYCNLPSVGKFARMRIANGYKEPHNVRFWSVGNENWGAHEIGAKDIGEWGSLVRESAKMMRRVDPDLQLSAAALAKNLEWTYDLLKKCGDYLDWISIHEYWDRLWNENNLSDYDTCMAFTADLSATVRKARGILEALGLEKRIRIAVDEWNLRGWHHPNVHTKRQASDPEKYLTPRNENDDNSAYTMADAVFSACYLNTILRNADIVGMANFAPIVNVRGCIYCDEKGVVLRSTYHVFDLYVNVMGERVIDLWSEDVPRASGTTNLGERVEYDDLDCVAALREDGAITIAVVNKSRTLSRKIVLDVRGAAGKVTVHTLNGPSENSYNDHGRSEVKVTVRSLGEYKAGMEAELSPHSVSVIVIGGDK